MKPRPLSQKAVRRLLAKIDDRLAAFEAETLNTRRAVLNERRAITKRCPHADMERVYLDYGNYVECRVCGSRVR